jgi:hypothetical protein
LWVTGIGAAALLILARRRPELVRQLVQVSGGFHHEADVGTQGMGLDEMVEQTVAFLGARDGECPLMAKPTFPGDGTEGLRAQLPGSARSRPRRSAPSALAR